MFDCHKILNKYHCLFSAPIRVLNDRSGFGNRKVVVVVVVVIVVVVAHSMYIFCKHDVMMT